MSIGEQIALLKRGTAEIVPEEELVMKLERSQKEGKPLKVKLGLDPTAPDIHLGIAVVLRKLRQFQNLGHEVIVIIGDFTAMIGDPSGKSETRRQLSPEEVRENARTYEEQYCKVLDASRTRVVFNSAWLNALSFADVIRVTSRATVARVLERDDFANRLKDGRPIGMHETLYPICQAYDSVHLHADIEMGGSDQKFNILMGRDLQREFGQEPQIALLMPILPGLDGVQKMSKSLGNYIGVSESPKTIFGKVMSLGDEAMPQYFEMTTDIPMDEVRAILKGIEEGAVHPMDAKKLLAREIVGLYHGPEAAREAQEEFERVFSQKQIPDDIPTLEISSGELEDGRIKAVKLITLAGFAKSNSDARRLIQQRAMQLDGEAVENWDASLPVKDGAVLKVGKLRYARLKRG
ncbi:MAG: tyrosine--tRNA ligase [Armatimonadetes bacterium]|nr:tyrosine--tRNA ligase [Armatimonadota bacterium]